MAFINKKLLLASLMSSFITLSYEANAQIVLDESVLAEFSEGLQDPNATSVVPALQVPGAAQIAALITDEAKANEFLIDAQPARLAGAQVVRGMVAVQGALALALADVFAAGEGDAHVLGSQFVSRGAKFLSRDANHSKRHSMMVAKGGEKAIDTMIYAAGPKGRVQLSAQDQLAFGNKKMNWWIQGMGNASKMDDYKDKRGYHSKMAGALTGINYKAAKDVVVGGAVGYSHTRVKVNHGGGHTDIDGGTLSLYASAVKNHFVMNGYLTGVFNRFKQDRNISINNATANSKHNGYVISPSADIGYNLSYNQVNIKPFVKLSYDYTKERGYQENGAGVLNLRVNSTNNSALRSEFGARFAKEFKMDGKNVQPFLSLSYVNVHQIKKANTGFGFVVDTTNTALLTPGSGKYRNYAAVSLGANIFSKQYSGATTISYSGQFNQKYSSHQAMLGYAMPF